MNVTKRNKWSVRVLGGMSMLAWAGGTAGAHPGDHGGLTGDTLLTHLLSHPFHVLAIAVTAGAIVVAAIALRRLRRSR